MASPNEKLARSLTVLRDRTQGGDVRVFASTQFGRTDRDRLISAGFLREIMQGWLMVTRPDEGPGETASWYASFWQFARLYLNKRFDGDWILSPESSLGLHADDLNVPRQVVVQSPTANNAIVNLPHAASIFAYRVASPIRQHVEKAGMKVYPPAAVLAHLSPTAWSTRTDEVVSILGSVGDADLVGSLVDGGHVAAAGRITGACRRLGRESTADAIARGMKRARYVLREEADPFKATVPLRFTGTRPVAPAATRIRLLWAAMRDDVVRTFDAEPRAIEDREAYMGAIDEGYVSDAYHSLSIEGYQVSEELIERVRRGGYDPENDEGDRRQRDAMAAKGYWLAFQEVRETVSLVLGGRNPAALARERHLDWSQALFAPSVEAGLLGDGKLVGYRSHFVFIRGSNHVPVSWQAVPDAMDALFECLQEEDDPRVRAVLGHYVFTFIHPLADGNGRCGRFLMNLMLASGGYPWTIIPVDRRGDYMAALEAATGSDGIKPFAALIAECVGMEPPPPRRLRRDEQPRPRPETDDRAGPGLR